MRTPLLLLLFPLFLAWGTPAQGRDGDPLIEAARLREAIEMHGEVPKGETYELAVAPVYHQGSTMFCWAYSGLHTLRTYYYAHPEADPKAFEFLKSLDSKPKYQRYVVSQVGHTGEAGWPVEAVYFYQKSMGADLKERWVSLVPSSQKEGWFPHPPPDLHSYTPQSYYLPLSKLVDRMREGFIAGAPTAFCTTAHCVTIFGAIYVDGSPAMYRIADSGSGSIYNATPSKVHAAIADVMVLEKN